MKTQVIAGEPLLSYCIRKSNCRFSRVQRFFLLSSAFQTFESGAFFTPGIDGVKRKRFCNFFADFQFVCIFAAFFPWKRVSGHAYSRGRDTLSKAFITLVLDRLKLRNFQKTNQDNAAVNDHLMNITHILRSAVCHWCGIRADICADVCVSIYHHMWGHSLLVLLVKVAKTSVCGTSKMVPTFFIPFSLRKKVDN